jgi:hypothetical protein
MRKPVLLFLPALLWHPARAQGLPQRIANIRNGTATFSYASRPDVCGDGHAVVLRQLDPSANVVYFSDNGDISGTWIDQLRSCVTGPVRIRLTVQDHRIVTLWPAVGGGADSRADVSLGTVGTGEAVGWLIGLARSATEQTASRALLSAALADSVRISTRVFAIARDRSLPPVNREQALKWASRVAAREDNDTIDAGVRTIAADESDDRDVRERAIRVLVHPQDDAFLRDLYGRVKVGTLKERIIRELAESGDSDNAGWITQIALDEHEQLDLRDRAVRVLGEELHQVDRVRALYPRLTQPDLKDRAVRVIGEEGGSSAIQWLETVAENSIEAIDVRDRAIRILGEQGEMVYLRQIYPHLDATDLRDRVLRSIGETGGAENLTFLRRVALDPKENADLRDRALRAISEAGVRSEDLAALYDTIGDQDLRYRLIGLMAERGDVTSRGKLAQIARSDPNPDLRERARKRLAER